MNKPAVYKKKKKKVVKTVAKKYAPKKVGMLKKIHGIGPGKKVALKKKK